MASKKHDYEKEIRALQRELKKKKKQHKKTSDVKAKIEKLKRAAERAKRPKKSKKVVKAKPKKVRRKPRPTPPPKKKRKKPKKKVFKQLKLKPKVYRRSMGDAAGFSEDETDFEIHENSSHGNKGIPQVVRVQNIFDRTLLGALRHGPLEKDEVNFYRYGIHIRVNKGAWSHEWENEIQNILEDVPHSSIHVVDEGTTFSLRINFGHPSDPTNYEGIKQALKDLTEYMQEIYNKFRDWGYNDEDIGWMVFFDTDEYIGGTPA